MGKLKSFLALLSFSPPRSIVGFNFSADAVRIVFARVFAGKTEVLGIKTCSIEGMSEEDAAMAIRETVKGFKLSDPLFICTVDSPSIISKNIEIPSIDEHEIKEIIDLQAGRYTPFAREEILVDHIAIDVYHNSYTKVLVIIVVKETIRKQVAILEKAGFHNLQKIQLFAESIATSCAKLLGLSNKSVPCAVISIDNKSSDFIIIFRGKVIFIRSIPLGADAYRADREHFPEHFVEEVKKSLESYKAEDIEEAANEILLIGAPETVDAIKMLLFQTFNIPTRNILFYGSVSVSRSILADEKQSTFLNAIASVLYYSDTRIDLRPSELKMRMVFRERSRELLKTGIFVMAIIIQLFMFLVAKIYYRSIYLSRIEEQQRSVAPEVESLEKVSTKIMIIKSFFVQKHRSLGILLGLYDLVPETVYLKNISVEQDGKVTLRGTADPISEVYDFVLTLENSPTFAKVVAQNISNRKEAGKEVADFEITCIVEDKTLLAK